MKFTPKIISRKLFGVNRLGKIYMVAENEYEVEIDKKGVVTHIETTNAGNIVKQCKFVADIKNDVLINIRDIRNTFNFGL